MKTLSEIQKKLIGDYDPDDLIFKLGGTIKDENSRVIFKTDLCFAEFWDYEDSIYYCFSSEDDLEWHYINDDGDLYLFDTIKFDQYSIEFNYQFGNYGASISGGEHNDPDYYPEKLDYSYIPISIIKYIFKAIDKCLPLALALEEINEVVENVPKEIMLILAFEQASSNIGKLRLINISDNDDEPYYDFESDELERTNIGDGAYMLYNEHGMRIECGIWDRNTHWVSFAYGDDYWTQSCNGYDSSFKSSDYFYDSHMPSELFSILNELQGKKLSVIDFLFDHCGEDE